MSRRALLAKVHIAKKELGMDDGTYRQVLAGYISAASREPASSAAELSDAQLSALLDRFRAKGWQPKTPRRGGRRPHNYHRLPEYVTKVEALLADMGLSWAYADSIARNITGGKGAPERGQDPGVERLAWVRQPRHWVGIIAALHVEQEKRGLLARVDALLLRLGRSRADVDAMVPADFRGRWQRSRTWLRRVVDTLSDQVGDLE